MLDVRVFRVLDVSGYGVRCEGFRVLDMRGAGC